MSNLLSRGACWTPNRRKSPGLTTGGVVCGGYHSSEKGFGLITNGLPELKPASVLF